MQNGRCRLHGGATPRGPASANYKTGAYSKYIPSRLAEKYAEAMADTELMEFRADAALLQSRLCELLETGESLPLWDETQRSFEDLRDAMAKKDGAMISDSLTRLDRLIHRGMADALRWADIYRVTEQIGKTKEREHKRLVQASQMMSTEEVLGMIGLIARAIKENVSNRRDIAAIMQALEGFGLREITGSLTAGH